MVVQIQIPAETRIDCKQIAISRRQINMLIAAKANLNEPVSFAGYFEPPIIVAAMGCLEHSMTLLLSHGADAKSIQRDTQWTALHCLGSHGTCDETQLVRMMTALLAAGADINASGSRGTPLHIAIRSDRRFVATVLVREGASVTVLDEDGATALHWAAYKGDKELVDLLIRRGSDVNLKASGGTPIEYCKLGRREGHSIDDQNYVGVEAILKAHGAIQSP